MSKRFIPWGNVTIRSNAGISVHGAENNHMSKRFIPWGNVTIRSNAGISVHGAEFDDNGVVENGTRMSPMNTW